MLNRSSRLLGSFLTAFLFIGVLQLSVSADEKIKYDADLLSKYRSLKIGWLTQIPMFVSWTQESFPGPNTPFIVGIVGEELNDATGLLTSKRVNNRPIEVKRYTGSRDLQFSHILYVSASQDSSMISIIQSAAQLKPQAIAGAEASKVLTTAKYNVLTISDTENFLDQGGVIRFVALPDKLGMEINLIAARKQGITISSQLLKLANKVIQ